MPRTYLISILIYAVSLASFAQDPGWPRSIQKNGAELIYYQPQVDDWKDHKELYTRMAVTLTPAGGKRVPGVVYVKLRTDVDTAAHTAFLSDPQITKTYFPALDPATAQQMEALVRQMMPPSSSITISLERLVASVQKPKAPKQTVPQLKNDPPRIFVSYSPALLVLVDGKPVRSPIKDTKLETVVNVNWPVFAEKKEDSKYYMLVGKLWLTAPELKGPWAPAKSLPKDMKKLLENPDYEDLKGTIPPPQSAGALPEIFFSDTPSEVIIFKGQPIYAKVPGTQLVYANNTDSDVFVDLASNTFYYLTAGRWFSAPKLSGPWTFASANLPKDFWRIPSNSPASRVLMSVPGTPEAQDAVLMAQIPTTVVVDAAKAAQQVKVAYSGEPQFKPIEGTTLQYATNTPDKVIKVGDLYYVCYQGVWFQSTSPQGPWQTAASVPPEIYKIPPSSPVYNVTYVTQTTTTDGNVESSYTAGYMGTFVTGFALGACVAWGTGYYYPPYVYYPGYGYPVYYPYGGTYGWYGRYGYGGGYYGAYGGARWGAGYNPYTGNYVRGGTAYGPYGSRSAAQAYNPHTGTYARGGSASTGYGRRSAAGAYNPYTGAYGATRQGSNAYSQWGSSVVTRGNQAVGTQHYSTAQGSVGRMQTSSGGRLAATDTGTFAGRTASGDMYAGRDGSVYRNTDGNWQRYDNGGWNTVDTSAARERADTFQQQRGSDVQSMNRSSLQSSEMQGLQNDYQNRQRGAAQSQRYQSSQRSMPRRSGGSRRR